MFATWFQNQTWQFFVFEFQGAECIRENMGGGPKMVGFPNWPMAFPTRNHHFGV